MEVPSFNKDRLETLAVKMKRGNRVAAAELYDELLPKVYGFFFARLRKREIAEDLTHDIFVKLIEKIGTFEPGKGRFIGWFWQVVRRYLIDYYRLKKETPFSNFDDDRIDAIAGSVGPEDPETRMAYRKMWEFLDTLADHERELFEMRFVAEMPYRDIAASLGRPENTLRVEALRIKEKIKKNVPNYA